MDTQLSANSTELTAARGAYPSIGSRFDSLVLSGGNVATLADGPTGSGEINVVVDSSTGFIAGARVAYSLASGVIAYNTIYAIFSETELTFAEALGTGGIPDNALITMISESEYQAAMAVYSGGTASATLPAAVASLEREVNVKAFGAYGDGSSHVIGGGAALTAAQAAFPLTHAAFTITAADEYDWCAIQEAVLTGGTVTDVAVENVYIPVGTYMVNRTITVPLVGGEGRAMVISGGGRRGAEGTIVRATTNISVFLIPGQTTIRMLTLVGNDSTTTTSIGIRIGGLISVGDYFTHANCVHVTIASVTFSQGFYRCISSLYECDQLEITHCTSGGTLGQAVVYLSNDHAANNVSPSANVLIEQCHFANMMSTTSGDSLYGIYLMGTEDSAIRNCVLRGHDNLIYLTATTGVRNEGLLIEGIHCEINQELKGHIANRWRPNTAYALGAYVRPGQAGANGWWYKCTSAGTSAANPLNNSIRTASYAWTVSARGTNEYYCTLAAGTNPSLSQPFGVMVNGTAYTYGFAGRLAASEWGYGDNDSKGYNTIYIRLAAGGDPDSASLNSIWMTSQEPTWPTTYGATVSDGTVVWQAYKQSNAVNIAVTEGAVNGGLRITGARVEHFISFIYNQQGQTHDACRVYVNGCTVRTTDMVLNTRAAIRSAVTFENSSLEGCIRPFSALSSTGSQSVVFMRFCVATADYTGALGDSSTGIASWMTGEPNYGYLSEVQINDVDATIDLRNASQIMFNPGSGGATNTIYVPFLPSNAFLSGLKGKTITITNVSGTDALTVSFTATQGLLTADTVASSLSLPDIGDSVTIRLGTTPTGNPRWAITGSHGI
jgi:hypothetical protein